MGKKIVEKILVDGPITSKNEKKAGAKWKSKQINTITKQNKNKKKTV